MTFVLKKPRRGNAIMQTINNKIEEIRMKKAWRITYTPDKKNTYMDVVFADTYTWAYLAFMEKHRDCYIVNIEEIEDRKI